METIRALMAAELTDEQKIVKEHAGRHAAHRIPRPPHAADRPIGSARTQPGAAVLSVRRVGGQN
jgi:hypothetical protein